MARAQNISDCSIWPLLVSVQTDAPFFLLVNVKGSTPGQKEGIFSLID